MPQQQAFSLHGELLLSFGEVAMDGSGVCTNVTERSTHDDAGRLIESVRYYPPAA